MDFSELDPAQNTWMSFSDLVRRLGFEFQMVWVDANAILNKNTVFITSYLTWYFKLHISRLISNVGLKPILKSSGWRRISSIFCQMCFKSYPPKAIVLFLIVRQFVYVWLQDKHRDSHILANRWQFSTIFFLSYLVSCNPVLKVNTVVTMMCATMVM